MYIFKETWFNSSNDHKLWIRNNKHFSVFRCDRPAEGIEKSRGGGVMILIPRNLNPELRTNLSLLKDNLTVSVWNSIHPKVKLKLLT